jgi:methyl-accepting chemotaxis protein
LIDDSVSKVESGKQVNRTDSTMRQLVSDVNKVSEMISEISLASQEQSSGIEEVNQAIIQMDEATQQNAALVEQAAAASSTGRSVCASGQTDQRVPFKPLICINTGMPAACRHAFAVTKGDQ